MIPIDTTMDPDLRTRLSRLCKNELVGIVRAAGSTTAHKGMGVDELLTLLGDGGEGVDPIDPLRQEIMAYIAAHRAQLTLTCHGDCFQHSWAQVLQCHSRLKGKTP